MQSFAPGQSRLSEQENIPSAREPLAERQQQAKRTAAHTPEVSPAPSSRRQRTAVLVGSSPRGAASISQRIAGATAARSPAQAARPRPGVLPVSSPRVHAVVLEGPKTMVQLVHLQVVASSEFLSACIQNWPSWRYSGQCPLSSMQAVHIVRERAVPKGMERQGIVKISISFNTVESEPSRLDSSIDCTP